MNLQQLDVGNLEGFLTVRHDLGNVRAAACNRRPLSLPALAQGAATADQLAERTRCHPRYVAEWLRGQAAGGYVRYDPASGEFSMSPEQAYALADPGGPITCPVGSCWRLAGCVPSPRSPRRSGPERASAGTNTTRTCSPGAICSSEPPWVAERLVI